MTGKPHSAEHRAKISQALKGKKASDISRARMSAAKLGLTRAPHSAETKAKMSVAHCGKTLSPEHRAKLSAAKLGKPGPWLGIKRGPQSEVWRARIAAGNIGKPAHYPKRRFYYRDIPFRSSWEMFVAQALDRRGIRWKFEPKRFPLGDSTYTPDFYLPDLHVYWEVKGYFGPQSQRTVATFRSRYPEVPLVVVTQAVIVALDSAFNPRLKIQGG